MNRIFLSWDKPVCRAVAERLLSLGNDLHRHLVLVPTRESGRQLREFLASISRTQAIFAPQVIPADQFLRISAATPCRKGKKVPPFSANMRPKPVHLTARHAPPR